MLIAMRPEGGEEKDGYHTTLCTLVPLLRGKIRKKERL